MVIVFIFLCCISIARIVWTIVDHNQIAMNQRLELLQLFPGESHNEDVAIVKDVTLFEEIDNAKSHKDSGINKLQQDNVDEVVVKNKATIQHKDNAKSQTTSTSVVTGNTMSNIILAIAVHTSRLDRYIAVRRVLSLQKESHLCQNGNIVVLRPFFFRDQCHDCPQELHQLTKKNAFHRSVEMLLSASNAAKADFVFKMDDDTFLNTAALSRRVCALEQRKNHYQGFLMYADRLFASGGAGYLVSSSVLQNSKIYTCKEHQYEDVGLANCLWAIAGISPSHLDVNPDTPEQMLVWSKTPSSDHRSKATFHDAVSFHYISAERQVMMLPQKNLFPKRIHQIWLGNGTPPWGKLQTCRELHPDWEITLWTTKQINNIRYDSKYQDRGSFISKLVAPDLFKHDPILKKVDLLKIELLYRFGGFAMDADQICIRRLDPLLAIGLNSDYAAGHEHNHAHSKIKSLIANGVQISHQYSSTVFQLLLKIPTLRSGGPAWKTTGPCLVSQGIAYACGRNQKLLQETSVLCSGYFGSALHCSEHDVKNITLLSSDVFFPYHHSEKHKMASCSHDLSQSFTVQYWSSTSGGYKKEVPENNINLKTWRLDEKGAIYYGSWAPGACLNGIREHAIAQSKNSGVKYRLTPPIPTGSLITLSSEANVDLGRGFSRWKNMQVVDPISSIHVLGASPVIKVHLPAESKHQIKITYHTSITPNEDGSNVLPYTQPRKAKIIYHHLIGRCGNQLFQIASIFGIAARNSASVCMSGNEISKYFEGTPPSCSTTKPKSLKNISEKRQYATFHDFKLSNDVELTGYFQSYRYFSRDVRSQVKIKKSIINLAQKTLYMFQSKTLVGIHMRRFESKYLRIPPNQYFINAKKMFTEKYTDVQFVVTCDDTEWCNNQPFLLQDNVFIVKKNNEPVVDMAILAGCHHIILSVGTFGWWAAFLGPDAKGGTVVYYDSEFVMEHKVNNGNVVLSDFYPPNWIAMSSDSVQTNLQSFASVIQNGEKSLDSFFTTTQNDWCPGKYTDGGKFITQLYKDTASHRSMTCKNIKRIGNSGDGGKFVCMDTMHQNECVVYSMGSRLDFTFELDIIRKLKCKVYTFDCTVGDNYASKIPSGIFFYPWCVGDNDLVKTISSDLGHTGEKAQYYTIGTIMKKLQHTRVDLLKMDIERHEFAVVKSLDSIYAPNQIVFETHVHNAYGVWGRAITQAEWDEFWAKLYSFGYLVFSYEPNPLCLCCCEFSMSRRSQDIVQGQSKSKMFDNTIVTAYFKLESKHPHEKYIEWMKNIMSLQDAMVVFTTDDMVATILKFRAHALDRTKVISTTLQETLMAKQYSQDFWQRQLQIDPERGIHQDYRLYWIWNQKIEFTRRVVDDNPFHSNFFSWVDIGYFRNNNFNGQTMLKRIPYDLKQDQVLLLDVKSLVLHIKHFETQDFVGAGFIGGYSQGIRKFHDIYYSLIRKHSDEFIGKEQPWMWKVCQTTKGLCKLILPDKEHGDPWFYMAPYLTGNTDKQRKNVKLGNTLKSVRRVDPSSQAFVDSLFSSKMNPEADSDCNIIVSSFATTSLYDKAGPQKTQAKNIEQHQCPASRATYKRGVLSIPNGETGVKISTVPLDRGLKQLRGSGLDMGNYMPPQWKTITGNEIKLDTEHVRLQYADGKEETFLQAQPKIQVTNSVRETNSPRSHILLLVIDNLSRQTATWTLPKTMAFLKSRRRNTFVYNRLGSTGHSTAPSMTPILTGKPYDMDSLDRERVRTRRYIPSGIVDSELITSLAREHGYATAYVTDQEDATFLGCKWWNRSWFDHVAPPPAKEGESKTKCIGQFTNHQHGFQYIRSLWERYEEKGHPVFTYYHASHGHAIPENAQVLDADLMHLVNEALERNCVVALIGDHGPYAIYQSKLPLGTLSVPDVLATQIAVGRIAELNQRRLVSQFDLYKTLRFLVTGTNSGGPEFSINLLTESVMPSRNCSSAGIPDFRCFCSVWTDVDRLPTEWKEAVELAMNKNAHQVAPQQCARASVVNVSLVRRMVTCVGLSRFHFHRRCDYDHAPHQHVQWLADVDTSLKQRFTVRLSVSRVGLQASGSPISFENHETDTERDAYLVAASKVRPRIARFRQSLNSLEMKQLTRYGQFESCTPPEANAQFCVCNHTQPVSFPAYRNVIENLIIVAHPDDEAVFFGNNLDNSSFVVIVTDANSHGDGAHRRKAFEHAMASVGVNKYEMWDFPESPNWRQNVLGFWNNETKASLRKMMIQTIKRVKPKRIYTHGKLGEYGHINHREIHAEMLAAFRQVFQCNKKLLCVGDPGDIPVLFTFKPALDYSNNNDRLGNLPKTCKESNQRKRLIDTYVNAKALTVHNFRKLCLEFEKLYPNDENKMKAKEDPLKWKHEFQEMNTIEKSRAYKKNKIHLAEPGDVDHFWNINKDRNFMKSFYPKLKTFKNILDVGARGYNYRCKDLIGSSEVSYYQIEPHPPRKMNNDGLLQCTVQDSLKKYPEYIGFFDVVIDFGVLGWGAVELSEPDIVQYLSNICGLLKDDGVYVLKIDSSGKERLDFEKFIYPAFRGIDFVGFKRGLMVSATAEVHFFTKIKKNNSKDPLKYEESIDLVIMWSGEPKDDLSGVNRDDGILKYTIRSFIKNTPWIRNIFVFADPMETPRWFSEFGTRVILVNRCLNYIGGNQGCPTNNGLAAYLNIHTITGLSERFIVSDDDIVVTKPLSVDFFFKDNMITTNLRSGPEDMYPRKYVSTVGGVDYIVPLNDVTAMPKPKVHLPKHPKMVKSTMHVPWPFLKSTMQRMHAEYPEWFHFVSTHTTRFCFVDTDKLVLKQPGNIGGACYHENPKYAMLWYIKFVEGRFINPLPQSSIPEFSLRYEDISADKLHRILSAGKPSVNINDSAMWMSTQLERLKSPEGYAEYVSRKQILISALEMKFPLQAPAGY